MLRPRKLFLFFHQCHFKTQDMSAIEFLIVAITSIIAIMNPVSTAAVFSILTEKFTPEQ